MGYLTGRGRSCASKLSVRAIYRAQSQVQTQHAFNATYAALTAPHHRDTTALRRRLLRLSVRLAWHPYWNTAPSAPAARTELRQLARTRGTIRTA